MRNPIVKTTLLIAIFALAIQRQSSGQQTEVIRAIGWNVESGDSSAEFIAAQIAKKEAVDLWGFAEITSEMLTAFEEAYGSRNANVDSFVSSSGGNDRLGIMYNADRFELIEQTELRSLQIGRTAYRPGLIAKLRIRPDGPQLVFMVNHLARGNADSRREQARLINEYPTSQPLPLIAVGDYNVDIELPGGLQDPGRRDAAFDLIILDNRWSYVEPRNLVKTQESDSFNTILDCVFVANLPEEWTVTSRILERETDQVATSFDFDDDDRNTDHRPLEALIALNSTVALDSARIPVDETPPASPTLENGVTGTRPKSTSSPQTSNIEPDDGWSYLWLVPLGILCVVIAVASFWRFHSRPVRHVFISYRRKDTPVASDQIYRALLKKVKRKALFYDLDSIPVGSNFRNVLSEAVGKCDVLIAVIGPNWIDAQDQEGNRRLDDPEDYVRIEIEAALERDVPIIPVLVGPVEMPPSKRLPISIKSLNERQATTLRAGREFESDLERLVEAVIKYLATDEAPPTMEVPPSVQ